MQGERPRGSGAGSGQGEGGAAGSRGETQPGMFIPPPLWDPHPGQSRRRRRGWAWRGWAGPRGRSENGEGSQAVGGGRAQTRHHPCPAITHLALGKGICARTVHSLHPGVPMTGRGPWMGTPGHRVRGGPQVREPLAGEQPSQACRGAVGQRTRPGGRRGVHGHLGWRAAGQREGRGKAACGQAPPPTCAGTTPSTPKLWFPHGLAFTLAGGLGGRVLSWGVGGFTCQGGGQGPDSLNV